MGDWARVAFPVVILAGLVVAAWQLGYFDLKKPDALDEAAQRASGIPWLAAGRRARKRCACLRHRRRGHGRDAAAVVVADADRETERAADERGYSRSASIGSTRIARRAGTKQAAAATMSSSAAAAPSMSGSIGPTPNSKARK
jgi:hypothetical protein